MSNPEADLQERAEPSLSAESAPPPLVKPGGQVDPEAVRAAWEASESDEPVTIAFELQRDVGTRLDRYLTQRIGFMSRTQIQRLIDDGAARINGRVARAGVRLRLADRVEIDLPPPPATEIQPEDIPLEALHEDAHCIVVNKHAGIIVHPARSELGGTMINALAWRFGASGALSTVGAEYARPGVVHRLDRDTTGCIVFAKTDEAHWRIARQFEQRSVDKRYLAIVQGAVEPVTQLIDAPIGPHPSRTKGYREKQAIRHDDLGKPCRTICRVHERYRLHDRAVGDQRFSLVELELQTGRTHQIRVHMAYIGYPLVGDEMYGGRRLELPGGAIFARHALHAALLAFEHPSSGEPLVACAPLPEDLRRLLAMLRRGEVEQLHPEQTAPLSRLGVPER